MVWNKWRYLIDKIKQFLYSNTLKRAPSICFIREEIVKKKKNLCSNWLCTYDCLYCSPKEAYIFQLCSSITEKRVYTKKLCKYNDFQWKKHENQIQYFLALDFR